jgi:hypothetical protein
MTGIRIQYFKCVLTRQTILKDETCLISSHLVGEKIAVQ